MNASKQTVSCFACDSETDSGKHKQGEPLCQKCFDISEKFEEHGYSYLYGRLSERVKAAERYSGNVEVLFEQEKRLGKIQDLVIEGRTSD
jgi:hypothetical protein